MKISLSLLVIFFLLNSCSKNESILPHAYLDLKVEGSGEEFIWEEIDGEWIAANGTCKLLAISDQLSRFSLNLQNITDTGFVSIVTVKEINFTDAINFRPYKIFNGYIRITSSDERRLIGEYNVEFESVSQMTERRRIKGHFGLVNPL